MPVNLESSTPADFKNEQDFTPQEDLSGTPTGLTGISDQDLKSYVTTWRNQLDVARTGKKNIWNECWQLYRGLEDWENKEEWQSKIVVPKAWGSIKQAVSVIKRLLNTAKDPWTVEAVNPDDLVMSLRASQMTDLLKVFLEKANFEDAFSEGLETGFITGVGIWKVWWGYKNRQKFRSIVGASPGGVPQKQIVMEEFAEGQLFIRAVDPYNFYWLPGSKLNNWVGTIEDVEIPKWELINLANQGVFDPTLVAKIKPKRINEFNKQSSMRFGDRAAVNNNGPNEDTGTVILTEYYGPVVKDGVIVEQNAHIIIANDDIVLKAGKNPFWNKRPPYVGYSPLQLPFRTEGVGLVEMVREIDKALNRLANMSVDTLMFKLLPVFEMFPDVYENDEDLETSWTPGKVLRRNAGQFAGPGIQPVVTEDISQGAIQVQAQLDRAHQEGALVGEIQQYLPRYRGVQSASEVQLKQSNQDSFFGGMAVDIEKQAISNILELSIHLILQFLNTATDERIASILGLGGEQLKAMSREELFEIVNGDYKIKVNGLSGQLEKAEILENLVQFMNLIGQNAQAWLPYLNQDKLLQRILEAFRPSIRDIEEIIADPETVEASKAAMANEELTEPLLRMYPQIIGLGVEQQKLQQQAQQQAQQLQMQAQQLQAQMQQAQLEAAIRSKELELQEKEIELAKRELAVAKQQPKKDEDSE